MLKRKEKIFGVGWAKTGTTTLGKCFETLGYDHQSQRLDLVHDLRDGDLSRIRGLVEKKESFEDWPWIILFREASSCLRPETRGNGCEAIRTCCTSRASPPKNSTRSGASSMVFRFRMSRKSSFCSDTVGTTAR